MNDEESPAKSTDNLAKYRAKRSADRSPEPVGTVSSEEGRLFVVHKHAARQLHWDLRLEMDGVLKSWAVPRGPSYDMADKRLAVHVEDHPLEYGDFEGIIPAGNYGAGGIIVWDRGEWIPLEDWREGLEKGKLLFELRGYKLHGKWTLVKIKKAEKEWLLIKERDSWVKSPGDEFPEESVLSGLTVEEIKAGDTPASKLRKALEKEDVPRTEVDPWSVQLTHAETEDKAFTRDDWIFELKLDGYRLLAAKTQGEPLLLTRNGNDYTAVFPEVARAIKALPVDSCIVDGEVVVLDESGKPSFAMLQRRGRLTSPTHVRRAAVELPAAFFVFDFIAFEDFDLRPLPLTRRKELLTDLVPKLGAVRYLSHIAREGEAFLREVSAMGLEGIIAKKADAPYRAGRTPQWLKIKAEKSGDFVIVGFTEPRGSRSGLGALQLADYVNDRLVYAGRAGTGFSDKQLRDLRKRLEPLVRGTPPCQGPIVPPNEDPLPSAAIPETKTTTWVEPQYVCEVRYREWTPDGLLRHPAFMRMRDDKSPDECQRQGWQAPKAAPPVESATERVAAPKARKRAAAKTISLTNLNKVFWPADGYTKGDLIEYYRVISRWILPYLRNRPVVMTRFPDGIDGKSFYQKDAPEFAPDWIRTVGIWSEDTQREIQYFVCDDEEALVYIANLGSIPLHIWMSRVDSLQLPDWCVIDLDPKEAPFKDVIKCAQVLHRICQTIGLPDYVKTTGKSGLHVMLPLGQQLTYEQTRTLGELLARLVIRELGDIATITRHVTKRGDKVYLDYLQNRTGQLIVAPFSVRPLPGAAVSMPLTWDEVKDGLDPRDYTIKTAPERMERLGNDPVLPVLGETPDLTTVLGKLGEMMAS
ncbi:MAG TPA: DNA ligase D [Gemmatimonadaceae bacterium]|nr:DNA ligase D [Gemmatimonadaceae bacterium]